MTVEPPHPGELLREYLARNHADHTQQQVADALKVSRVNFSRILNGHAYLSSLMLLKIAHVTGTTPERWADAQIEHQLYRARRRLGSKLEAIKPWGT